MDVLESRRAAAALFYAIDLEVNGEPLVDEFLMVGDELAVTVKARADYEDGDLVNPNVNPGGVFAGWIDLQYNSQWLRLLRTEASPDYANVFHAVDEAIGEYTRQIDDFGGALSRFGEDGIFLSEENYVTLGTAYFVVEDTGVPGNFTGVALDATDVDPFYASLAFGLVPPQGPIPALPVHPTTNPDGDEVSFAFFEVRRLPDLHNESAPGDVDGDGVVAPIDALHVIDDVWENGPRTIADAVAADNVPDAQVDVNNDGVIGSAADAFEVIGILNEGVAA